MTMGSTCAGRDRTDVEKMSIYSLQRLLSRSWSHGDPENLIMAMISSGVSGFTLSGTHLEWIYLPVDVIVVRDRVQ
jgi:hypothetical protein